MGHLRLHDSVKNVDPVSPGLHDIPTPHLGQVLRDNSLGQAEAILDLPYRLFAVLQELSMDRISFFFVIADSIIEI